MEHYKLMGRYFGYPECCSDWFLNRVISFVPLTEKQEQVHNGYGFIPCPLCAEKINNSFPITELIKNRICSTPYPKDGGRKNKELEDYLEKNTNITL